jgi:ketosteroid isomerase-like protein
MTPSSDERDAIFKSFGRAFFKQDLELMYQVVTDDFTWTIQEGDTVRVLNSRQKIVNFFAERKGKFANVRFEDVVFNHAPDASFMTYRMTGTEAATGAQFTRVGVERYTFRDGKLTEKDVYSRPADL